MFLLCLIATCQCDGQGQNQGVARGQRDNPKHRPATHWEDGDSELMFGEVRLQLLRKGCGLAVFRNFGDIEVGYMYIAVVMDNLYCLFIVVTSTCKHIVYEQTILSVHNQVNY